MLGGRKLQTLPPPLFSFPRRKRRARGGAGHAESPERRNGRETSFEQKLHYSYADDAGEAWDLFEMSRATRKHACERPRKDVFPAQPSVIRQREVRPCHHHAVHHDFKVKQSGGGNGCVVCARVTGMWPRLVKLGETDFMVPAVAPRLGLIPRPDAK